MSEKMELRRLNEVYLVLTERRREIRPSKTVKELSSSNLDRRRTFTSRTMNLVIYFFWFSILAFPFIFIEIKIAVGLFLILASHLVSGTKNQQFDLFCILLLILNMFYLYYPYVIGSYNEYSFEFLFPLHIIFVGFWWLSFRSVSVFEMERIARIAIPAAWVSWAYAMALLFEGLGYMPFQIPNVYNTVNVNRDIIQLASNFVSALLFTSPILSYYYLKSASPVSLSLLIVFWVGILATGRRSVFMGLGVCMLFLLYESIDNLRRITFLALTLIVFVSVGFLFYSFDILSVGLMIDARIDSFNLFGENVRIDQALALWDGFLEKPLLGNGLGSNVAIIRDPEKIWRYELSYVAALFRFGVLGCFAYLLLYFYPVLRCIARFRSLSLDERALFLGVLAQLFAYAVNPTLDTFDTSWQLLVPIFLIGFLKPKGRSSIENHQ